MLRDVHTPQRIIASFILACVLLLTYTPIALASSDVQAQRLVRPSHYLVLGDSLAFGLQPNGDNAHGYVNDVFTYLQSQGVTDYLNLGCSGETSSSFITDGKCSSLLAPSSQFATGLAYLQYITD